MYGVKDIEETLLDYTCKDVIGIIIEYTFDKCWVCKKLDVYDIFIRFCINKDNPIICFECYNIKDKFGDIYQCKRKGCLSNFLRSENSFCRSCFSQCKVYCSICLDD